MQKSEKPVLPTRKTRPGGFFRLSIHRAGLDQPWSSPGRASSIGYPAAMKHTDIFSTAQVNQLLVLPYLLSTLFCSVDLTCKSFSASLSFKIDSVVIVLSSRQWFIAMFSFFSARLVGLRQPILFDSEGLSVVFQVSPYHAFSRGARPDLTPRVAWNFLSPWSTGPLFSSVSTRALHLS